MSKGINAGLTLLAFSDVIKHALSGASIEDIAHAITYDATFGLVALKGGGGAFDLNAGLQMYGPGVGAIAVKKLTSYVLRHMPVR